MGLVKQVNTKPRTQGIDTFDNALLQAGGGREKLATIADQNKDLTGLMDQTSTNIQNKIGRADDPNTPDVDESSGAIGQTAKSQADAYKTIQDALNNWKTGFTPKVSQAQQQLIDQQNRISQDIANNPYSLDQETMDLLGLSSGQRVFGTNLGEYLNQVNPGDINASNVASAEDYARYAALADLAGDQSNILNPENAAMSGTAPKLSANQTKLQQDLAAAQAGYENLYGNARSGVLNSSYLLNPNAQEGYAGYIPGAMTDRRDLNTATPKELEEFWLPLFTQAANNYGANRGAYDETAAAIQRSLDDWKSNQSYNNVIKKN